MNYYELLEVSPSASVEVIKNAYKTLAKKYHPDAYEGDKTFAEEKMKILNEAISVLENEAKRREYNIINGIYQTSENYGYDGENSLNINVDENGEPVFFSYSDDFEEESGGKKGSFMDAIDDFISNRKTKKNKTSKSKNGGLDLNDLAETLNGDNLDNLDNGDIEDTEDTEDNSEIIRDISEMPETDYTDTDDLYDTQDFRTVRLPGKSKSAGSNVPRWYYIAIACLIPGIIVMFFLVLGSLNLDNIRDMINRMSGSGLPEDPESAVSSPSDDYTEQTNNYTTAVKPEIIRTSEIAKDITVTNEENENITESPTEPTAPLVIPPPVATPATTTPPIIRTQSPTHTQPPAATTEPPTAEQTIVTTEEITEEITEITEEITEVPGDITEPTEELTTSEETVPEETILEEQTEPITEPEHIDATGAAETIDTTDDNIEETVSEPISEITEDIIQE